MKLFSFFVLLLFVLGIACAPAPPPEESIDLEAAKSSLLEADKKWAEAVIAAENKADTIAAQFDDDSWLLPPDAPIAQGKDAIRGVFEQIMSMPGMDLAWIPSTAVVSNDASMCFTIGSYKMKLDGPDGNPMEVTGKYMTAWRKQADGSWKVISDMFNADAPMTVPE